MIGMSFDGFDMQTNGITTANTTFYSPANRMVQEEQLAESDGVVFVKDMFGAKSFTCTGDLKATTISQTDILIDTFITAMNKAKKIFAIDYAGGIRQIVVTPQSPVIVRDHGMNYATWSVEFRAESAAAMDANRTTLVPSTVITASSTPINLTVGGSYKAEPYIILTLNSVTAGSPNKTITLSNGTTLRGISITRDWTSGDVLEIDSMAKTVYVNSIAVESSGLFPKWDSGTGILNYQDDFSARNANIFSDYVKRYM